VLSWVVVFRGSQERQFGAVWSRGSRLITCDYREPLAIARPGEELTLAPPRVKKSNVWRDKKEIPAKCLLSSMSCVIAR
jgi:hypothetical protein